MDDTTQCPICGNKLRNLKKNKFYHHLNKTSSFIERSCFTGKNHYCQLITDIKTGKVDYIKFSLDPKYSKFIEINYIQEECSVTFVKNNIQNKINLSKMVDPDFPNLVKLKQQVNLYATFL